MSIIAEIDKAISAHGLWKARLRQAIATGESEWEVTHVSSDKNCAFGTWLHSLPNAEKARPQWKSIQVLHAEFHLIASQVLALALKGQREEASDAIKSRSAFATTSANLTKAMTDWKEAVAAGEALQHEKVA
jgi:methyl-accepting chemotaxis protein